MNIHDRCTEEEFRHILAAADMDTMGHCMTVNSLWVDVENENTCADLRARWADRRLFLKDSVGAFYFNSNIVCACTDYAHKQKAERQSLQFCRAPGTW